MSVLTVFHGEVYNNNIHIWHVDASQLNIQEFQESWEIWDSVEVEGLAVKMLIIYVNIFSGDTNMSAWQSLENLWDARKPPTKSEFEEFNFKEVSILGL